MNIIVAVSENNAIGCKGTMPWHLSADLKYFRATTMGHAVIMGRKTFESIGRPLPGRRNIVVSRNAGFTVSDELLKLMEDANLKAEAAGKPLASLEVYPTLEAAIAAAPDDAFVIGGGQIYNQAWPFASRYYITRVHAVIDEYDTTIPNVPEDCHLIGSTDVPADENNDYPVTFEVWER